MDMVIELQGVVATLISLVEGGGAMSTYETISLLVMFCMLVLAILALRINK